MNWNWNRFISDDESTHPTKKSNYIVTLCYDDMEPLVLEANWAEYFSNGNDTDDGTYLDWNPQFYSQYITAWTNLPEPYIGE